MNRGFYRSLSPFLVCKSGNVGSDGAAASTTASSAYQPDAQTEDIWLQITLFEPLGAHPHMQPLTIRNGQPDPV
jgi:hypothetical protein